MPTRRTMRKALHDREIAEITRALGPATEEFMATVRELAEHRLLSVDVSWQTAYGLPDNTPSNDPQVELACARFNEERLRRDQAYRAAHADLRRVLARASRFVGDYTEAARHEQGMAVRGG